MDKDFIRVCRSWGPPSSSGVCVCVCVCVAFLYVLPVLFFFFYSLFYLIFGSLFTPIIRPSLSPVWMDRILRILGIENYHYTAFIQPDLLASCYFGPKLNKTVQSLVRANQRRKRDF